MFHCKVSVDSVKAPLSGPLKLASLFVLSPLIHSSLMSINKEVKYARLVIQQFTNRHVENILLKIL